MNVRFSFVVLPSAAVLSLGLVVGCGQQGQTGGDQKAAESNSGGQHAEAVNPHDVPITEEQKQQLREEAARFADAVAKVKQLRDAVERETKNGPRLRLGPAADGREDRGT